MGWGERVAIIVFGAILLYLTGAMSYRKGRGDYAKEYNAEATISNWRNAYYRTYGRLEQKTQECEAWKQNCFGVNIKEVFNVKVIKRKP